MAPLDKIIDTQRLRLKLLETLEDGSAELADVHKVRSDKDATKWSIYGFSKTLQDTQKIEKKMLPEKGTIDGKAYRAPYIVYLRDLTNDITEKSIEVESGDQNPAVVVGVISVTSSQVYGKPFPDHLTLPDSEAKAKSILKLEVGYMFLPGAWGKGYCTEALRAVMKAYGNASDFWAPYQGVYIYAITGYDNGASQRVLEKAGFSQLGVHAWEGDRVFLAGEWREPRVRVFSILLQPSSSSSQS